MPNLNKFKCALFAAATLLVSLNSWAEVKVVLTAAKVVQGNGSEQKQSSEKAKPGDVIEYVADYKNTEKSSVSNVKATLPVPSGMEYIPETAVPTQVMASTDDVHYASVPLKRNVKHADGKVVQELVPYSEYRSLRWDLGEIAAGAVKSVKARMKVKTSNK
jgi:uncharacterized repeat protein (TIGR01451 family)